MPTTNEPIKTNTNQTNNKSKIVKTMVFTNSKAKAQPKKTTTPQTSNARNQQQQKKRRQIKSQRKTVLHPYIETRLNPTNHSMRKVGVPDGSQTQRILVPHRMLADFTFGTSGAIEIVLTPTIPSPVWYRFYDTESNVNGRGFAPSIVESGLFGCMCLTEWKDMPVTRYNTANIINDVASLYDASMFRIVSAGWTLSYTGNAMYNAGTIRVNSQKMDFNAPDANATGFKVISSDLSGDTVFNEEQAFVQQIDHDPKFDFVNDRSVIISLARGAHGVLRRSGNSYDYKNVTTNETYIKPSREEDHSLLMCFQTGTPTANNTGVVTGIDTNWDSTFIKVLGSEGQTFVLDLTYIIEYAIASTSNVFALARIGDARNNLVLADAENRARLTNVAYPGGDPIYSNAFASGMSRRRY